RSSQDCSWRSRAAHGARRPRSRLTGGPAPRRTAPGRMSPLAPERLRARIGRYEPRRELGRGTMGVVYEAWDPDLGRTIALKVVAPAFSAAGGAGRDASARR